MLPFACVNYQRSLSLLHEEGERSFYKEKNAKISKNFQNQ